jgi:signal transduction histidine kinase
MNLYSSKQIWKLSLLLVAAIIVGLSLWYNNNIVDQIREEEQVKVRVWSAALKKKANLLYITNQLFDQLREEERKRAKYYAAATTLVGGEIEWPDYSFFVDIIQDNKYIPSILINEEGRLITARNIDLQEDSINIMVRINSPGLSTEAYDSLFKAARQDTVERYIELWARTDPPIEVDVYDDKKQYLYFSQSILFQELRNKRDSLFQAFNDELVDNLVSVPVIFTTSGRDSVIATNIPELMDADPVSLRARLRHMPAENYPIEVEIDQDKKGLIFYENSFMLTQLRYYPAVQFLIVGLFLFIAYLLFSMFRKAEQNQVWVGLAKETAHQLGTPLSSLMAWMELLELKGVDKDTLDELGKDVKRLEVITDRFSKIGSETELKPANVTDVVQGVVEYLQVRSSRKVEWEVQNGEAEVVLALINKPLFEWVIENLCKNAIDAMGGTGKISIDISEIGNTVNIDVSDTGKGIPSGKFKTVFQPGYTTKQRGWGLGLSLVKRIVDSYHNGSIFVHKSEVNKGTTFRIVLKK